MSNNWPQKRKNSTGDLVTAGSIKRENSGSGQITRGATRNSKIFTPYHCTCIEPLVHWQNDSIHEPIWWENIKKAAKSAYLACPTCPKYNPGKPVHSAPQHFKLPSGPFEVWQMDFKQLPCLMDINMFQSWFVCFLTGSKLSLIGRSLLIPWLKFC